MRANKYDLSASRYRQVDQDEAYYEEPRVTLERLLELERVIMEEIEALREDARDLSGLRKPDRSGGLELAGKFMDFSQWHELPFTRTFDDKTAQAHKVDQDRFLSSGKYPIIDQGQSFIAGYADDPRACLERQVARHYFR